VSTITAPRPRVKPVRTVRLVAPNLLRITERRTPAAAPVVDHYTLHAIGGAEPGPAYELAKVVCADFLGLETEEPYAVNLGLGSCECLGHLKHGHKTVCRHRAMLAKLVEQGRLS
jgi:hypothetical protein